jgi:ABC-type multidrug transport system permease subunit
MKKFISILLISPLIVIVILACVTFLGAINNLFLWQVPIIYSICILLYVIGFFMFYSLKGGKEKNEQEIYNTSNSIS